MKIKINRNMVTACLFIGIMVSLTIVNFSSIDNILREKLNNQSVDTLQKVGAQVEDSYRTSFKTKNKFIDVYGFTQLVLDKSMIGNFEFIKDKQGFMHLFSANIDTSNFNEEIVKLNKLLVEKKIPLLYVQVPAREIEGFTKFATNMVTDTNKAMDSVIDNLIINDINYIDIRDKLDNNEYPKEDVYLKTDIHLKTSTEFWILQQIIENLENQFGIKFEDKSVVLDKNNYSIVNKKMLGNLGRSAGKYFTGLDDFELYYPNFSTDFIVSNYSSGVVKTGEFRNSVMNGLESDDYNSYWVTNYLQWPTPYYNIENTYIDKNNILILMDSMGLRTAAYLSLLCNNVTILDTRYFDGVNYLERALATQQYDAVVILQSNNLYNFSILPQDLQAQIISENIPTEIERNKKNDVRITIKNTSEINWSEDKLIRLCIWQDGIDYGYRVNIPDDIEIKPGEEYTFIFHDLEATMSNSTYIEYQMLKEGVTYFGEKKRADIAVK